MTAVPDTKFVLDLAQKIEEKKAQLAELQSQWEGLFSQPAQPEPQEAARGGRKIDPDGIAAKVLATLDSNSHSDFSVVGAATAAHLPELKVRKALANLLAANRIKRTGRGRYAGKAYQAPPENEELLRGMGSVQ